MLLTHTASFSQTIWRRLTYACLTLLLACLIVLLFALGLAIFSNPQQTKWCYLQALQTYPYTVPSNVKTVLHTIDKNLLAATLPFSQQWQHIALLLALQHDWQQVATYRVLLVVVLQYGLLKMVLLWHWILVISLMSVLAILDGLSQRAIRRANIVPDSAVQWRIVVISGRCLSTFGIITVIALPLTWQQCNLSLTVLSFAWLITLQQSVYRYRTYL